MMIILIKADLMTDELDLCECAVSLSLHLSHQVQKHQDGIGQNAQLKVP